MSMISFFVPGNPIAQPRQRHTKYGHNYIPADHPIHQWKDAIRAAFPRDEKMIDGPVRMRLSFFFRRPKSMKELKPHTRKPDLDNLQKAVKDALNGIAYIDDSQVNDIAATKQYAPTQPGLVVTIFNNTKEV